MHASSFENMQRCVEKYAPVTGDASSGITVVDLGAADVNGSYRPVFSGLNVTYVGVDLEEGPGVDLVARDPYHLPLPDGYADIVVSGQALEHSEFFWVAFGEMVRVLKPNGFTHIVVPDMGGLFQAITAGNRDINDVWYVSPSGPISFHDVIYGWGQQVEQGNLYYCHKTGFTGKSLTAALTKAGFRTALIATDGGWNLYGFGFKVKPDRAQLLALGLS